MSRLEVDSDQYLIVGTDNTAATGTFGFVGGRAAGVATAMPWIPMGSGTGNPNFYCTVIGSAGSGGQEARLAVGVQLTYDDVFSLTPPSPHEFFSLFAASTSTTISTTVVNRLPTGVRCVLASSSIAPGSGVRFIVRKGRNSDV